MSTASAFCIWVVLFVSFMSGNSTRLGVNLAEGNWPNALDAIGLIVLFVAGAAVRQPDRADARVLLPMLGAIGGSFAARGRGAALCIGRAGAGDRGDGAGDGDWRMRCFRSAAAPASD